MNQVALITDHVTLYWYSIILALAAAAGVCLFMACCSHRRIKASQASLAALLSVALSLLLARLLYWDCRADTFENLWQALTTAISGYFALSGVFFGCMIAAAVLGKGWNGMVNLLDCMSVAGCGAIALGRLGGFFTDSDRGQAVISDLAHLPWAYPVVNAASGELEYRLATFLFQAVAAAVLFGFLCWFFFRKGGRNRLGDVTLLFLLVYGASQAILDSTRYDSLFLQINGFVSMTQILAALGMVGAFVLISVRAVRNAGLQRWMLAAWSASLVLLGGAGYMEYYVQRHGRLALFAYAIMEHCLVGIVTLGLILWAHSRKARKPLPAQEKAGETV